MICHAILHYSVKFQVIWIARTNNFARCHGQPPKSPTVGWEACPYSEVPNNRTGTIIYFCKNFHPVFLYLAPIFSTFQAFSQILNF